tara:strand:- start:1813 stop:2697 length:885 start_codon:yes stop_codon:yes gene_type:complete
MSKKPASLTSELLARKGEAEPSTIDPSARMTLSAGPGFSNEYNSSQRGPDDDDDRRDDRDPYADEARHRPMPPEPEIIYTAEETGGGGGGSRLIITAILGLIIVGGIFLAVSGNQPDSVAPVATDIAAQAPEAEMAPATGDVAPLAEPETVPETLSAEAETVAEAEAPVTPAPEAVAEAPAAEIEIPVVEVPVAPVKAAEAPAPAKVTAQSGGAYVVQLLALQDRAAAQAAWGKIAKKHSGILGAHALDIEEADLGAKGTWYRVRAAGFSSKSAAASACASLKAAKQDCIVKKR